MRRELRRLVQVKEPEGEATGQGGEAGAARPAKATGGAQETLAVATLNETGTNGRRQDFRD